MSRLWARTLHHLDRLVFRLTKGRHTFANLISGLPVVMLTTTCAKSGKPRTLPVLEDTRRREDVHHRFELGPAPPPGLVTTACEPTRGLRSAWGV